MCCNTFFNSSNPRVVIFVIDANDKNRFDEAREEFQRILHEPSLNDCVKIVLANLKKPCPIATIPIIGIATLLIFWVNGVW